MRHFFMHMIERHHRGDDLFEGRGQRRGTGRGDHHCHSHGRHGGPRGRHDHGSRFGGRDDSGMFRGRKFSSDDLQLLLLAQLQKGQSHGYQLIKALAELSEGIYTPSPGMVYPALTYVEEIGYADVTVESNKKLYSLSAAGSQFVADNKTRADELLAMLSFMAKRAREMRTADDEPGEEGSLLREAMQALRGVLRTAMAHRGENADKIAVILKRAASEINDLKK